MCNWRGKAVVCASQPAVAGNEDGGTQSENKKRYEQALVLVVGWRGSGLDVAIVRQGGFGPKSGISHS